MSLLSPDRLGVALFPDRLVLARASGSLRRHLKHKEIVAVGPARANTPLWRPAIDALAGKVAAGTASGAEVTVVLSNFFVHYALVPWSDALDSDEEKTAFARHCFVRVHGAEAESWVLKLGASSPGKPRLACAIEATLIDALNEVMTPVGRRYRSLQPHLMASFNRWRTRLGEKPSWFVVAEPGLLCLALLRDGQWQSLRTIKVGPDWLNELPGALTREACLADDPAECDEVLVFAPEAPHPALLNAGKWRIKNLLPVLLPGMAAGVDAPYSIALGA